MSEIILKHSIAAVWPEARIALQVAQFIVRGGSCGQVLHLTQAERNDLSLKASSFVVQNRLPKDCNFFVAEASSLTFVMFLMREYVSPNCRDIRALTSQYLNGCFTASCGQIFGVKCNYGQRDRSMIPRVKNFLLSTGRVQL